jgi:hypothetical protein
MKKSLFSLAFTTLVFTNAAMAFDFPFPPAKSPFSAAELANLRRQANRPDLDGAQDRVVQTWTKFYWSRYFLLLSLDSQLEVESILSNSERDGSLMSDLLVEVENERLLQLSKLWDTLRVGATPGISSMDVAAFSAEMVRDLKGLAGEQDSSARILASLKSVRSHLEPEFQVYLTDALNACGELMKLKAAKPVASTYSSLYTVPVCEGQPDFTKAENVDAGFELYVRDQKLN